MYGNFHIRPVSTRPPNAWKFLPQIIRMLVFLIEFVQDEHCSSEHGTLASSFSGFFCSVDLYSFHSKYSAQFQLKRTQSTVDVLFFGDVPNFPLPLYFLL